jgi:hypothetical protein
MTLLTYSHVIKELKGLPALFAEAQIVAARKRRRPNVDPSAARSDPGWEKKPLLPSHSSGWIRTTDLAIMSGAL